MGNVSASESGSSASSKSSGSVSKSSRSLSSPQNSGAHGTAAQRPEAETLIGVAPRPDDGANADGHGEDNKQDTLDRSADLSAEKLLKYLVKTDASLPQFCVGGTVPPDLSYSDLTQEGKEVFDRKVRLLRDRDTFYAAFFGVSERNANLDKVKDMYTNDVDLKEDQMNRNNVADYHRASQKVLEVLNKDDLEVKLIFTNLEQWKDAGFLHRAVMRRLANVGQYIQGGNAGRYGFVHTALSVGPYIVEWDEDGLVWPVELTEWFRSDNVLAEIDLSQTHLLEKIARNIPVLNSILEWFGIISVDLGRVKREKLNRLAQFCVDYNRYCQYSFSDCNCQTFVDGALGSLEISQTFRGNLAQFIQNIRKHGTVRMMFNGQPLNTRMDLDNCIKREWSYSSKHDKILLRSYASMMEKQRTRLKSLEENDERNAEISSLTTILTKDFRNANKIAPFAKNTLCAIL